MKLKISFALASLALVAGLALAYSTYAGDDCCKAADTTSAKSSGCCKATAASPMSDLPVLEAAISETPAAVTDMTPEQIKACAEAHGMTVEECMAKCAKGPKPACCKK